MMNLWRTFLVGLTLVGLAMGLAFASPAVAVDIKTHPVAVVELFTSQGCSSCPPADAFLTEIQQRPDVLALAYHVDYWDYIGWKDTMGDAANSDLQRAYAQNWGKSRIYTPQLVINGSQDYVGSNRQAIEAGIVHTQLPVAIELTYEDGLLLVGIAPHEGASASVIYLVTFKNNMDVTIERGENRGKSISYAQVVTSRQAIGMWNPEDGVQLQLPLSELLGDKSDGVVVMVQQHNNGLPGPIIGASLFQM